MSTMLSIGQNQKLGKKVAVFNLPQGRTCPGKTAVCAKICYAAKAERLYKTARKKREQNLMETLNASFFANMLQELKAFLANGGKLVRIHESGDFYSQEYLDTWIRLAKEFNPSLTFLAYTKSLTLDFSAAPDNMKIYDSTDSSMNIAVSSDRPKAHIVLKGETPPAGYATCTHTSDKHYCGTECKICWMGNANVYFPQH